MEDLEKILSGYDFESQKRIRELYNLSKTQLILFILNLEETK
jgi:hypothetical protein